MITPNQYRPDCSPSMPFHSWLFIIGKMPQNTAKLTFLVYGGLGAVDEDPIKIFDQGHNRVGLMFYKMGAIW